jgi:hypothetical protein
LIHPVRNDAPLRRRGSGPRIIPAGVDAALEFLTGFISKDSRIPGFKGSTVPGLEGGKWKVDCGLDHFLPSTFCSLTLDPLNAQPSEDSVRDEQILDKKRGYRAFPISPFKEVKW